MTSGIQLPSAYPERQMKRGKARVRVRRRMAMVSLGRLSGRLSGTVGTARYPESTTDDWAAWYFWNANTGEVTWTNPLEPTLASSTHAAPARPAAPTPVQPPLPLGPPPPSTRAHDPSFGLSSTDIDPDLAHLLPPDQRGMAQADQGSQKALFNSRTGRFTASDYAYSVDHLDEYNRAKRMSSHYFDVDAWEKQKAEEHAKRKRDEEMGVSSQKKITKKDMVSFVGKGDKRGELMGSRIGLGRSSRRGSNGARLGSGIE